MLSINIFPIKFLSEEDPSIFPVTNCALYDTHLLPLSVAGRMTGGSHSVQQPYEVSPISGLCIDVHTFCSPLP